MAWVKIVKNYPGVRKPIKGMEGYSYQQHQRLNIPESVAKKLISNHYAVESCPPWEDNVDKKAAELKKFKDAVVNISNEITSNGLALDKAKAVAETIPQYEKTIEALQTKFKAAQKARDDFAAKNNLVLEKKTDGKSEEKTDGNEAGPKTEGDNTDAAGQAASAGQKQ